MKNIIVFDLDGTLADHTHRRHLLPTEDLGKQESWQAFNDACEGDALISDVADTLRALSTSGLDGVEIYIVSSRSETVWEETAGWLVDNGLWDHIDGLLLRPDGDLRRDTELKESMLRDLGIDRILCCFDDNPSVIAHFRSLGLTVYDVVGHTVTDSRPDLWNQEEAEERLGVARDALIAAGTRMWKDGKFEGPELHGAPKTNDLIRVATQSPPSPAEVMAKWRATQTGLDDALMAYSRTGRWDGVCNFGGLKADSPRKTVLVLNGPPGVGKDTLANALAVGNCESMSFELASFKTPMFNVAKGMLGAGLFKRFMTDYNNRETKEQPMNYLGGESPRSFFIWISESVMKPKMGPRVFGRLAAAELVWGTDAQFVVFTDGGFIDEIREIRESGLCDVYVARLHREGCTWGSDSRSYLRDLDEGVSGEFYADGYRGFYCETDITLQPGNIDDGVSQLRKFVPGL